MIILMEGLDNCGKTTQIKLIQKSFYPQKMFHVIHYSGFSAKNILSRFEEMNLSKNFIENEMFELLSIKNMNFILDRSYIGEAVYGPLYREYDVDCWLWNLEKKFLNKIQNEEIYLIVFYDELDNLINREDGLSFSIDPEKKIQEIFLFNKAFLKSKIKNKIEINICNKSIEKVNKEILNFIKKDIIRNDF